eukprot:TRINITY_DN15467_c0_g2_i1.p1 TRINITY_DN15467_c0_g2~~TRINITY_DN15467_c0_g2_i1.p1  ORF type:complete len:205 (+),score=16.25 TRINITY_DN15467_c0_g2_i1:316-930(+)
MPRDDLHCPQPGICDFATEYGPALFAVDPKKQWHSSRKFVTVTPCCSDDFFWLRYPNVHDSKTYALSVQRCLERLIALMYKLELSLPKWGACLAGQSMGAYMALEMGRAIPEATAAIVALAPCFDAYRLEHLARRLVNVPTWIMIGRNDSLCSFEECASLALYMRNLDAKCIRLTSRGIKGHSEVGKQLDKSRMYDWMLEQLNR